MWTIFSALYPRFGRFDELVAACQFGDALEYPNLSGCLNHVVSVSFLRFTRSNSVICEDGVAGFKESLDVGELIAVDFSIPVSVLGMQG